MWCKREKLEQLINFVFGGNLVCFGIAYKFHPCALRFSRVPFHPRPGPNCSPQPFLTLLETRCFLNVAFYHVSLAKVF